MFPIAPHHLDRAGKPAGKAQREAGGREKMAAGSRTGP
jgi:hypothetical protein